MFQQPRKPRLFQNLVEQIESAIMEGRLKIGDRLPSQREMVEMFKTSRATLREALRVLEQKGLIDVRLGASGGAVIKEAGTEPVTESLALLLRQRKVSLTELAEFREGVEGIAAALAADRAKAEDIAKMKRLLQEASVHLATGVSAWRAFSEMDNRIHMVIARACGNAVYQCVLQMVHGNIHSYFEVHPLKDERIMQENFRDLTEIVQAIEQRQAIAARSLMQSHVRRFNRYMIDQPRN
ncbi:MAG: FadR family transcriptional regulator [Desulfobacterales bacterium]|nr:FadR family transcriptional regulator [Desulfobacterales bacterium]